MTTVINLFAGPGAGKSTLAGEIYGWMKRRRVSCEYVPEFAKEITWEDTHELLDNQLLLLAEQHRRQYRLLDKVQYIITDSPLLLTCVYLEGSHRKYKEDFKRGGWDGALYDLALQAHFMTDALNLFVVRGDRKYDPSGRNQTEAEASQIDNHIRQLLTDNLEETFDVSSLDDVKKLFETLNYDV